MASPVTFFAPSLVVFFAPRTLALRGPEPPAAPVLRRAAELVMRLAAGFLASPSSDLERGEAERATSLAAPPGALRNGDGVRPEGVPEREMGGVGRLMAGLSQEEKKSSSASSAGVAEPSSVPSLMTTSPGFLSSHVSPFVFLAKFSSVSCRILLGVSSCPPLQLVLVLGGSGGLVLCLGVLAVKGSGAAILLEELCGRLVTANLHNTELIPLPFCRAALVTIFEHLCICISRHVRSRFVERTKEMCTPRLRWFDEQSRQR